MMIELPDLRVLRKGKTQSSTTCCGVLVVENSLSLSQSRACRFNVTLEHKLTTYFLVCLPFSRSTFMIVGVLLLLSLLYSGKQTFQDATAKKKYKEVSYGAHVLTTARSLLGSTLFGIFLTISSHYYKGMI
jgi:hypothetical protein